MAEPLAEALQTKMPVVPKGQRMTGEQISSSLTQFQPQKAQFEKDIAAATGEEAMAKQKQAEIKSAGMMGAEEAYGKAERGAMQQFEERKRAEPLPAFVPTQDNAQDMAGLFSLINVIGMVVGGGGKHNAQLAMNAMNGMLEGYQKGRGDLYKRERETFDKNFKTMIQKHKEFREDMEDAIRLAATDKRAGVAAAEEAAVKAGSDIVKAQIRKGDLVGAYNNLKETEKSANKALEMYNTNINAERQEMAAERRHRENLAQRERIQKEQNALREKLAKISADAKGKGGSLKPPAKITEGYIADTVLRADVDALRKDLENPKLQEQIKQYRAEAFLTEESKILNQLLTSDIPPELQQFLTKVRDIRNNYYLNISGKAVTGGEALRNYGTVPQPGDEPSVMLNKLTGMSDRINDSIALKQQLFGLPPLNLRPGTKTNVKPGEDYAIGSQAGKYEVGKVYTDAAGNKAKYLGDDEWEEQ